MQIIKDKQIIDNTWVFVDDETEISANGNITVSLARWLQQQPLLANREGKTGIRITSSDQTTAAIADNLHGIELIELDFPGFGDGRLFSHAHQLRKHLGYQGEIRAVGHFLPDQVYYLQRVGVNAFQLEDETQLPLALSCMNDFTVNYQS